MPDYYASKDFESRYTYRGDDLGAVYSEDKTVFRVWAPMAMEVSVHLYSDGDPLVQPEPVRRLDMERGGQGTWVCSVPGDLKGVYYTYSVVLADGTAEACDPYARAVGINGHRAMVIDLAETNPKGWETDKNPHAGENITDAIIYELHVRDLSADSSSGIRKRGKFLGLTQTGTTNGAGVSTGIDHIRQLGVTHVQLMPVYDFGSVEERPGKRRQYNWGYDPVNYNVPEGSYSTDPFHGEVRVKELKKAIKALHDNGLSVVMDVVYNHVHNTENFCYNRIVPGYFSRPGSNGSGCGNDTASERAMVRKFIVDSVKYWADEYHMDGFRFDLVGLTDTDTINAVMEEVHRDRPDVIFYGEGWNMDTRPTKACSLTNQDNARLTPGFAFFNDTFRDLLKGSVFDKSPGFVSGAQGKEETLQHCFLGDAWWCPDPSRTVNYACCHDNRTLIDRIIEATPGRSWEDRLKMNNLAAAIYLTAQGVPFMLSGEEMLRSKPRGDGSFESNSYKSPDRVNAIKWNELTDEDHQRTFEYYKGLIRLRKAYPVLRLMTAEAVSAKVRVLQGLGDRAVGFCLEENMVIIFNADTASRHIPLPAGKWDVLVNDRAAGTQVLDTVTGRAVAAPISALVLVKQQ